MYRKLPWGKQGGIYDKMRRPHALKAGTPVRLSAKLAGAQT